MKVIAYYLPQFHDIPENDEWWGKGFTEWVNVKKASPLFENHRQPRVPMNNNYYNLLYDDVKIWQAKIAKEHGIYGFCYYHYWFTGKMILEKPMEQMLSNKDIDMPFCICWANETWTKAWVGEPTILMKQEYGDKEDWKNHFYYLLPFFKDSRYILDEGKPLMVIYKPELMVDCLNDMLDYWNELAVKEGLGGLVYAYQAGGLDKAPKNERNDVKFKYDIEFQPGYAKEEYLNKKYGIVRKAKTWIKNIYFKLTGDNSFAFFGSGLTTAAGKQNYDEIWNIILNRKPESEKNIPGAFVDWDNTPRLGGKGSVVYGANPEKFGRYFNEQVKRAREVYKKDYIFIFAWNEWAEGGYLEPDEDYKLGYLEKIKEALISNNEWPGHAEQ